MIDKLTLQQLESFLWETADKLRAQTDAVEMVLRQAEVISEESIAARGGFGDKILSTSGRCNEAFSRDGN